MLIPDQLATLRELECTCFNARAKNIDEQMPEHTTTLLRSLDLLSTVFAERIEWRAFGAAAGAAHCTAIVGLSGKSD